MRRIEIPTKNTMMRALLWFGILFGCTGTLPAQYFTESFDTVAALSSKGWAQQNRSTAPGSQPNWFQGDPGVCVAFDGADTAYIAANYNSLGGTGTISNWLFSPVRTFANGEKISFWTRTVDNPNYPDRLQVRFSQNGVSTNVGTTAISVGDFTTQLLAVNPTLVASGYPNHWTEYSASISGLSGPTSGRVAFRYYVTNGGPAGVNSEYLAIDSFAYYSPPSGDLKMLSIKPLEYTIIPERHPFSGAFIGRYQNFGSTVVTDASLQVNIYNSGGTQIYSASSTPHTSLSYGVIVSDTVPAPSVLAPDSYTVEYIAEHSAADGNHSNDTLYSQFEVSTLTYARDRGPAIGSIGIDALVGGYVGQQFHFNQPDNLDSIWVHVTKGYAGKPLAAVIWDTLGGKPHQIVGATDTLTYTTDSAATYVLPMHGGPLQLPAGNFVVTMIEFDSTLHIGQTADVFTNGTVWLTWPTLPSHDWKNVEFFPLPAYRHPLMLRPILAACDLTAFPLTTPVSTAGAYDGTASANAAGGTPPYTYAWSTGDTTVMLGGLDISTLTVTVTDAAGCTTVGTANLMLVGNETAQNGFEFGAYPNPNDGGFRVYVHTAAATDISMRVLDVMGRLVWADETSNTNDFTRAVDLKKHASGIYFVCLKVGGVNRVAKIAVRH
jgi:hypothetical protein